MPRTIAAAEIVKRFQEGLKEVVSAPTTEFQNALNYWLNPAALDNKEILSDSFNFYNHVLSISNSPNFKNESQELKDFVSSWLGQHSYIAALHNMITNIRYRKLSDVRGKYRIEEDLNSLLTTEQVSAEGIFFKLYWRINELELNNEDSLSCEFVEDFKGFLLGVEFTYCDRDSKKVVINNVSKFSDMAHQLFCHELMEAFKGAGFSDQRCAFLSSLFDYLKLVRPGSANIPLAVALMTELMAHPFISIKDILGQAYFSQDKVRQEQGVVQQARGLPFVGFFASQFLPESHFVPLLDRYRNEQEPGSADQIKKTELSAAIDRVSSFAASVNSGLVDYGGTTDLFINVRRLLKAHFKQTDSADGQATAASPAP